MALTTEQLNLLLGRPHTARVSVDFVTPTVALSGEIPSGYSEHNVMEIPYINGVGDPLGVQNGMTVYVYDNLGRFKGEVRAKAADGTTLYVAENDEITWSEGFTFQVLRVFKVWTKFHRADVSGDEPVFYKDYGLAYTDQNENPPPIPIVGPHVRQVSMDDSSTVDVDWDASKSYALHNGATISLYDWDFEGGDPVESTDPSPTVTYNTPGQYLTSLTITDSNGVTAKAYRWLIVREQPDDTQQVQHDVLLRGDFGKGGWQADIVTHNGPSLSGLPDACPMLVKVDARSAGTPMNFGGFEGCEDIYFCGWLQKDTVNINPGNYTVSFSAYTIDQLMSQAFNFDTFVYDVTSAPEGWLQIQDLDVRKAGYHLLRWHSNVLELVDVWLPDDSVRTAGIDAPEGMLFEQLRNMMQSVRMLEVGCDSQGALWVQKNVQHMKWDERTAYGKNHDMNENHFKAGVSWYRQHYARIAMLELQAVAWDGSTPTALFGRSPGIVPLYEGKVKEVNGLAVTDQDECNTLCGMFYAAENNTLTGLTFNMVGNWKPALDVFPQAMAKLPTGFKVRGQDVGGEWVVVRTVEFDISSNGAPHTAWTVDHVVQEKYGRAFYYPQPEEVVPTPPTNPPVPPPPPPVPDPTPPGRVHIALFNSGVWMTDDVNDDNPHWEPVNTGLPDIDYQGLNTDWFARDPLNPRTTAYLMTRDSFYKNTNVNGGGAWVEKFTVAQAFSQYQHGTGYEFRKMKPQVSAPGRVWLITKSIGFLTINPANIWISDDYGESFMWVGPINSPCAPWYGESIGFTAWHTDSQKHNAGNVVPSAHNPEFVFFFANDGSASAYSASMWMRYVNGDFLHEFSLTRHSEEQWLGPPCSGHVPYKNNPDDAMLYITNWNGLQTLHRIEQGSGWAPYTNRYTTCDVENYTEMIDVTPPFGALSWNPAVFGSYTYDSYRIWFATDRGVAVGVSNDGGDTWTRKTDAPFPVGVCSGFPTARRWFFVGRHAAEQAVPGEPLFAASNDEGATWRDKTGDLWDQLTLFWGGGPPDEGLTTIAPEY